MRDRVSCAGCLICDKPITTTGSPMANIHIKKAHRLGKDDARQRVEDIAEDLKRKLHADYQWKGDTLLFKRPGAQGSIALGSDFVEVKVKLGMLVAPMKDKIQAQIEDQMAAYLS